MAALSVEFCSPGERKTISHACPLCFHSCMLFSLPLHNSSIHALCDLLTDEQKPNLTLF